MLQYFLKCRKKQNLDTPGLQRQIKKEIFFYQNKQFVMLNKSGFTEKQ